MASREARCLARPNTCITLRPDGTVPMGVEGQLSPVGIDDYSGLRVVSKQHRRTAAALGDRTRLDDQSRVQAIFTRREAVVGYSAPA
jgi:hypothetical protein